MVTTNKKHRVRAALKIGAVFSIIGFGLLVFEDLDPVGRYIVTEMSKIAIIGMLALGVAIYLLVLTVYVLSEGVRFVIKCLLGNKQRGRLFSRRIKPSQMHSPRKLPATQAFSKPTDN